MTQRTAAHGFRIFTVIWFGQFVSTIGSGLTGFALGVWIYLKTGSVTLFALNMLAFAVPNLVVSPLAGALADRWDRRWVMIMADSGAGLSTLAIALLFITGRMEIWHIYVATAFSSAFSTFQWPAYSAATTLLVPKDQLGRAGGMTQMGEAVSQLLSPAIAGALFVSIGLGGVILIDFATFLFSVGTLLLVRFPRPATTPAGAEGKGSLLQEAVYGWKYITTRPGLLGLLLFFASVNFLWGMVGPLIQPLLLDMTTPEKVGVLSSIVGVGMLAGTLVMSAWGGPKRRVYGVLGAGVVGSLFLALLGVRPSLPLIAFAGFWAMFTMPIMNASSQALWQTKVAADVQGRVFAIRRMIAWSTGPLAIILAGPLVDNLFQPLMNPGGTLAGSVGRLIGTGPGRGAGLLFIVLGVLCALACVVAYLNPRVRHVETELPDAVAESPAPEAPLSEIENVAAGI